MKCFFGLAAAAVILAFPSGAAAGDKEEAAVRRQVARFDAEVAKGNLDALLTLFCR